QLSRRHFAITKLGRRPWRREDNACAVTQGVNHRFWGRRRGGANLDYQAGGAFGYKIKPTIALLVGWRYLYVDYLGKNQFLFNAHMSGPGVGVAFSFPGAPSVPPSASCSAPTEVWSGDPVKVIATGGNFNPKHTVTYGWTGNGGKLSDANAQTATVDTAGMAPGSYSAVATITDPKEKK